MAQPESLAACIISNEEKSCWLNKSNFTSIFGRGMNHFGLNCLHGEKEGRVYLLCLFVCFCLCIICNCCNVRTSMLCYINECQKKPFFQINLLVTEMQMQVAAPSNTFTAPLLPLSSFYWMQFSVQACMCVCVCVPHASLCLALLCYLFYKIVWKAMFKS